MVTDNSQDPDFILNQITISDQHAIEGGAGAVILNGEDATGGGTGGGVTPALLTARDAAGLLDLVRGINPDGNDDAANALGV
ncbi:MAG: hypothetical protein O9328_11595, partial [Rhodobacteraceae bacterium]|nr:hypothetical protein [Paracoccaceae bacterium]